MTHFKLSAINPNVNSVSQRTCLSLLSHLLHRASSLSTSSHLCFSSATSNRQGHLLSQSNPDSTQLSQAPLILLHLYFSHVHRCFLNNLRLARASSLSVSNHVLMGRKYSLFKTQSTPLSSSSSFTSFFLILKTHSKKKKKKNYKTRITNISQQELKLAKMIILKKNYKKEI